MSRVSRERATINVRTKKSERATSCESAESNERAIATDRTIESERDNWTLIQLRNESAHLPRNAPLRGIFFSGVRIKNVCSLARGIKCTYQLGKFGYKKGYRRALTTHCDERKIIVRLTQELHVSSVQRYFSSSR